MDILKELQLFDDTSNDVEINAFLGQRNFTLHRSKSTEDLHSLEERHPLDIYRAAFPTSTALTGASTAVPGDSHGGIRAAGVLFTSVEAPVPDVDLGSVSHEMPMCLLQEDEGNEDELIRLLSGQGKEWLLQAAYSSHGASVEAAKDGAGSHWGSEVEENLLRETTIMLPDDLHLLVNAPSLDFHLPGSAGDSSPSGVDEDHRPKSPPAGVAKPVAMLQEATIQNRLFQELAAQLSGSGAVNNQTMTSVCELSAVLEATGASMISSSFPSLNAPGLPQASNCQTASTQHSLDVQLPQYSTPRFSTPSQCTLTVPSSPLPSRSLMSQPTPSPSLSLSMTHVPSQQSTVGRVPQSVTLPQDLTGALNGNMLSEILAAAVALCTPPTQSTEAVQPFDSTSQVAASGVSRRLEHNSVQGFVGGQTSSVSSRMTNTASLTLSRPSSVAGLTTSKSTNEVSLTPSSARQISGTNRALVRTPGGTSVRIPVATNSTSSLGPSAVSACKPGNDQVTLKKSPLMQAVSATSPTSSTSRSPPSPLFDCNLSAPILGEQTSTSTMKQHSTCMSSVPCVSAPSVSVPCVSIPCVSAPSISVPSVSAPSVSVLSVSAPSTTEEIGSNCLPLSSGSVPPVCSVGGISLRFPVVDWTSRRVQERVVPMSATPIIQLLPPKPQVLGKRAATSAESKPKRKHSGGWQKGKKRKTATVSPPKPPVTAYGIFLSEHRTKLTKERGTLPMSSLSKQLGAMWSALDEKNKLDYQKKADEDRQRYLCELKVYLHEVHQATEEESMGTLEQLVSENVSQEEDDDLLFCQICKLTFISLHNKKTHYSGKLHMDALLQCIKEALASRAENHSAKLSTHPPDIMQSQSDNSGSQVDRGSKGLDRDGDLNDKSSDPLKETDAHIDCSNSSFSSSVDSRSEDSGTRPVQLDSQWCEINENTAKGDSCKYSSNSAGSLSKQETFGNGDDRLNCTCPMEKGERSERGNVDIDPCRGKSNVADCHSVKESVHRYSGHRCFPQKRGDWSNEQVSPAQPSVHCLNWVPPLLNQTQDKVSCVDIGQAHDTAVPSECVHQTGVGCAELYPTISKQMADFAITYSCCVNTKGGSTDTSPPGYMHPDDHHSSNLAALKEKATRLKDSITNLLKTLENAE